MTLQLTGYRAKDDHGTNVPVIVPAWNSAKVTYYGSFTLTQYTTQNPDFPIECTWFAFTAEQKTALINLGIPNVWSIKELVDSGVTHWYFNDAKTTYLLFDYNATRARVRAYAPGISGAVVVELTATNLANDNYVRFSSIFSNSAINDAQYSNKYFRRWYVNNVSSDRLYFYYQEYNPSRLESLPESKNFWNGIDPFITPSDPYYPGGETTVGGGTGNFDGTSDNISIPSLPTLSAVDTGFITLFNPSIGQLKSLASYMWGGLFDLSTFKKLFADPMDAILGLSIVPVAVPNGGSAEVKVGNISTGISMTLAASQYTSVDCGTLNVNEYWGSYLDYSPYTKCEIYLPYIGTRPLNVDDIMDKAIHVVYHVDILSGACTAFVQCGNSVLYTFIGQCSGSIPITGNDWTNVINGVLTAGVSIGTMVASGGMTAPLAVSAVASTAINSHKPTVEKSGAMSGTGGMLGIQVPYLILTRPRQAVPLRQNEYLGYPSFITKKMASLTGYTEVENVHLDGIGCTAQEMREIENLLKQGVIF